MKSLSISLQAMLFATVIAGTGALLVLVQEKPAGPPHGVSLVVVVVPLLFLLATLVLTVAVPTALWILAWHRELRTRTSIAITIGGLGLLIGGIVYTWSIVPQ
jgi:hypothetical protein